MAATRVSPHDVRRTLLLVNSRDTETYDVPI